MSQEHIQDQDNRRRILDTAVSLFTEQGYDAVGVQLLCNASGISKPTLYHYYGNKRGLLDAIIQDIAQKWQPKLHQALQYHGDLPQTLKEIIQTMLEFTRYNPESLRLVLSLQHSASNSEGHLASAPLLSSLRTDVERIFVQASEHHGNMRGRHTAYAVSFLAVIFAYSELILNGEIEIQDQLAHQIMHQFSHGIYS